MTESLPSDSASNLLSSSSSSSNVSIHSTNTVSTATLSDCFELFTEREHLTDENSWLCPKCQKQTNAYKKLCISSVPPILIIHLKRFFYKSKTSNFKLTTPVWFPITGLDAAHVEFNELFESEDGKFVIAFLVNKLLVLCWDLGDKLLSL